MKYALEKVHPYYIIHHTGKLNSDHFNRVYKTMTHARIQRQKYLISYYELKSNNTKKLEHTQELDRLTDDYPEYFL